MAKARLKAMASPVPQTIAEADALLGEIGALQRDIDLAMAACSETVAKAQAAAAEECAPREMKIDAKFKALTAWAAANREALLTGNRRSVKLSQGIIGWRLGNPTVTVKRDKEAGVVAALEEMGLTEFLRIATTLDKEAILKNPAGIDGIENIAVDQVESFFAKPLNVETEQTKNVGRVKVEAAPGETAEVREVA